MLELVNVCNCEGCSFRSMVFNNLTKQDMNSLCQGKTEKVFAKGDVVIKEGDEIKDFFYLKNGLIKLYKKISPERYQIISIAKPFDFIGLLTIFSDTHYHYSVVAIEPSTICMVDLNFIKKTIKENGSFALELLDKISKTSDHIIKLKLDINKKHLRGRIAYILLYFADNIYNSNVFDLPISRREIAELIDMTAENVIRILSEFRKDKLLSINGKTIEILNPEMMKKICIVG